MGGRGEVRNGPTTIPKCTLLLEEMAKERGRKETTHEFPSPPLAGNW